MPKSSFLLSLSVIVLGFGVSGTPRAFAEQAATDSHAEPIVHGYRHSLQSQALGETRTFEVFLPASYEQSADSRTYPLILVLDGEFMIRTVTGVHSHLASVGRMPESIVVGLPNNTGRRLALYPKLLRADGNPPRSSQAEAYLEFFRGELLPELERLYRVADFRTLIGLSPTAAFTLHSLWAAPDLFQAHVAIVIGTTLGSEYEPGRSLLDAVAESLTSRQDGKSYLYISSASSNFAQDPAIGQHLADLESRLSARQGNSLTLETETVDGSAYAIVLPSVMGAFEMIYPAAKWDLSYTSFTAGNGDAAEKLDAAFRDLSREYGFPVVPLGDRFYNVNCLRSLGSRLQREDRLEESIAIFQRWIDHYPHDPRPYFYQAPVLEAASRFDEALATARAGLKEARGAKVPNLAAYEERFAAFEAGIAAKSQ